MWRLCLPAFVFAASAVALDCNGHAELCDRKYSNLTFVGAHNSPFVGYLPSDNQVKPVNEQLNSGVRFLTAQTHNKTGAIQLCHTYCELLDVGPLQDYLSKVKTWMDGNKNDVVTLLITNQDAIDVSKFAEVFKAVELDKYTFTPDGNLKLEDWPALGTLIATGKRLVVFMDYNMNTSKVPWIMDEFKYYFETVFDPTKENLTRCDLDRPAGASPDGRMYLVNHNLNIEVFPGLFIPNTVEVSKTNSMKSILAHSDICYGKYSRMPNVILLDSVTQSGGMAAQDNLNHV